MRALALIAEHVSRDEATNAVTLTRVVDRLSAGAMPKDFPLLFVYVEVHCEAHEIGRKVNLVLRLIDPDGRTLIEKKEPSREIPPVPVGRPKLASIAALQNIPFASFGPHTLEVRVDDECLWESPLLITKRP